MFPAAPAVPAPPAPPLPRAELPLVSIIIPTYNRPADLQRVLAAVRAQTYPAIEAIVVNDAGSPVDDVVAAFPFARLINQDRNGGAIRAVATGMNNAAGEYIALLPDDDWMFPDHVERVMYALLRCGAKLAHGNGLLRFVERLPDDSWKTTGFNGRLLTETLTQTLALLATPVSENGVIQHRSVFAEAGWFLEDSALNDLEFHMRIGRRYVFVHSDDVTFEFREHAKNNAKSLDFATELKRLYTDVHPVPGRPLLEAEREATYAAMAARVPGQPAFPPTFVIS
jgi:glycosyltransferase involved in cell wall biosynthesis